MRDPDELYKGPGVRVLAGYFDGITIPIVADGLWIMPVTSSNVCIALMNMSNCTNSAPSDECVTKRVERMLAEDFENTIGTVVWKNEYCVFALLNTIGRPLRAVTEKSVPSLPTSLRHQQPLEFL